MIKLTSERAYEDLREVADALVTKAQVGGIHQGEALEIVAKAAQLLIDDLKARPVE